MRTQSVYFHQFLLALALFFSSFTLLGQTMSLDSLDASTIQIPKNNHEVNLINKLNGYLPGTVMNTISGSPGAGSQIRSRGQASIYGNNDPLIILNGIPVNNSTYGQTTSSVDQSNRLIDINPSDITSVKWLTSTIATSLYGSRGRNGILLIETYKKNSDKLTITFNTGVWIEQVNRLPELQKTYAQGRGVGQGVVWRGPETGEGNSWGPKISDLEYDGAMDYPFDKNGRLVCAGCGNGQPANSYDNVGNFFVNGVLTQNHVAFSAPSSASWVESFHGSIGNTYNGGIIPLSNFKRSTFNFGADLSPSKKLTANVEVYYSTNNSRRNLTGSNTSGVMLGLLRNTPTFDMANGQTNGNDAAKDGSSYLQTDGSQRAYRGDGIYDNPFWSINRNIHTDQVNRFIISLRNNFQLTDRLSTSLALGSEVLHDDRTETRDENSGSPGNYLSIDNRVIKTSTIDLSSTFSNKNSFMSFQYTAGVNFFKNSFENQSTTSFTDTEVEFDAEENSEILGFYGLALHQFFNDALDLNLSIRNEYLSQLQRFDLYYGLESKLSFWKIAGLDKRGFVGFSFGRNGGGVPFSNPLSPPFESSNEYQSNFYGTTVPFDLYQTNHFVNTSLEPEKTHVFTTTLNSDFFNGRFSINYEYFNQKNTLIVNTPLNPTTGYSSYYSNGAKTSSIGHVLSARLNKLEFLGIQSSIFATFYSYANKTEFLSDEFNGKIILPGSFVSLQATLTEGESFGTLYGSAFERTSEGRLIVDSEGWPIEASEIKKLADPNPDFLMDVGFNFKWKSFQLSGLVSILHGAEGVNNTKGILNQLGMGRETEIREDTDEFLFNGVVQNGTNSDGEPIYIENQNQVSLYDTRGTTSYWGRYGFGGVLENSIEDLDWIRLRNIALSYSLPPFTKMFDYVVVTVSGKNLLLKTNYDGVDPELNGQVRNGYGFNYFGNPNTKSFGINIAFGL